MIFDSPLKDKLILAVDDEPDVLEAVGDLLDMCRIHKATDYQTALKLLAAHSYDAVILDIMGVNGFELLKDSTSRGFPTVMLTAHALTPEALKKAIKLGAVSFLPKERIADLRPILEDLITYGTAPIWQKTFESAGEIFSQHFGADWNTRDKFFREFIEKLKNQE
ncbi:MAG: response regulator [Deltaproteobacteria bacterium]|nr:response regulator [Deltaproteobacteria bacterium]